MSVITDCQPDYPILKKYRILYDNTPTEPLENLELYIFPEDFKSTYEPKYSKLNSYGIYPYLNLRTHTVTVRYGSRYILNKLEEISLKSLNSGVPIKFGTTSDYAAKSEDNEKPPISFITDDQLNSFSTLNQVMDKEKEIKEDLINYENHLENNLVLFTGFIELPINASGIIGKGDILDGFSFRVIEVVDSFRTVKIGEVELKIPPESYSYQETGKQGYLQYAADGSAIINVGFVQKGFTVNLPSAYTDTLEIIKYYKDFSLLYGGIEIIDNVGNSFNGWGYVNSISYNGAINRKSDDTNENNFLPNGFSFSVLSLQSFISS